MLSIEDNELLTRTGPDTPMGQFFRSFWMPVALSQELPEPDCPPIRLKVMGEDLVAFRDSNGRVGLIEPHCPHRGADLFFGRNEECGIRCVYHGWKFDVDGTCIDMPNVPAGSGYRQTVRVKAYPTREFGDVIWAHMGSSETQPELPQLEFGMVPSSHRFVIKKLQQCNWAQSIEGGLDTAHFSTLHMPAPRVSQAVNPQAPADEQRLRWIRDDPMPRFSIIHHDVGFVIGGARRAEERDLYWRITQFMLPSHSLTPSALPGENYHGYTWVPISDEACWIYTYVWNPVRPLSEQELEKYKSGHSVLAQVGADFVPIRRRENNYLIDREDQKYRTFTGVRGVAEQDAMIQDSQGLIADRTREHLTATDIGLVHFRREVLSGAKALMAGIPPAAAQRGARYSLRSGSWMADESVSFEGVMCERFGDRFGAIPREAESPAG